MNFPEARHIYIYCFHQEKHCENVFMQYWTFNRVTQRPAQNNTSAHSTLPGGLQLQAFSIGCPSIVCVEINKEL